MLTAIDSELYPNNCEVVEMPLHSQWVYLIQKNATSSLRREARENNLQILCNEQLSELPFVDVYIRDPQTRLYSGVNTFINQTLRDNPCLDRSTIQWFACRYLFLNRHFLPQFHWLINLGTFISPNTVLRFRNFTDINNIVSHDINPGNFDAPSEQLINQIQNSVDKLEFWLFVDQILQELEGNSITFAELLDYYKNKHHNVWQVITKRYKDIASTVQILS